MMESLTDAAASDQNYLPVIDTILGGKKISNLPPSHPAKLYKSCWDNLSVADEILLVLNDSRIVVPKQARQFILDKLHFSHSGIVKTANCRDSYITGLG